MSTGTLPSTSIVPSETLRPPCGSFTRIRTVTGPWLVQLRVTAAVSPEPASNSPSPLRSHS